MPALGRSGPRDGYLVYALVDPRDGFPFYVGLTSRPLMRWRGHHSDPASPAYDRVRDLRARRMKCRVRIFEQNLAREDAREVELSLIAAYSPTLLNSDADKRSAVWAKKRGGS